MLTRKLTALISLAFLTLAIGLIYAPSQANAAPGQCDRFGNCEVGDGDGGGGGKGEAETTTMARPVDPVHHRVSTTAKTSRVPPVTDVGPINGSAM